MLWIVIIVIVIISIFLYLIVHTSAKSIDEDMQEMLDEEQSNIVAEMFKEREIKKKHKRKD